MSTDEDVFVTKLQLIEVTEIRDAGMQALTLLAVSLGWNAMKKHNQPVVLTARGGHQVRLPTNTSIRMSVYQSRLATILLYSHPNRATPELAEAIIKTTKLGIEHARRLRNSVAESDVQLADRVINTTQAEEEEVETDLEFGPLPEDTSRPAFEIDKLEPPDVLDHRPETADYDAWEAQVESLHHVAVAERNGVVLTLTLSDGSTHYWCSFPGCRFHDESHWSVRGHNRVHSHRWGPLSDSTDAIRRRDQYQARKERKAAETGEAETAEAYSPVSSEASIIERYTADAIAMLDIVNRFVSDLDDVTTLLGAPTATEARVKELEEEVVRLQTQLTVAKVKAERWDAMRKVLSSDDE